MSKTIRVSDGVYVALFGIMEKGESRTKAIERLIKLYITMQNVSDNLGPSHYLKGRPKGEGK